ncbi:MAG: hypothetical protein H8E14_00365 [Candidatus Marinimicrobia bacterium]|nr:hypothetical protein [Candidatus Neomarinimicrobiota bacterium]
MNERHQKTQTFKRAVEMADKTGFPVRPGQHKMKNHVIKWNSVYGNSQTVHMGKV